MPDPCSWRVSVKREGPASRLLHERASAGWTLEAAARSGVFVLEPGERPVVLVSAGIGATPVLAMLHRLAEARTAQHVWWVHSAPRPSDHVFALAPHALLTRLPHGHEHVFFSRRGEEASLVPARDARLDAEHLTAAPTCRPARHRPHRHIRPQRADRAWREERGGTLLELAEACDVPTRWSCRSGVCHNCETGIVAGDVAYLDPPLEPPRTGDALICCSRPVGELVLDL